MGIFIKNTSAKSVTGGELNNAFPLLSNALIFEQATHSVIGIFPEEGAVGDSFIITDSSGKTVMKGIIGSKKTVYIPISKLNKGYYHLQVGNQVLQQFAIE